MKIRIFNNKLKRAMLALFAIVLALSLSACREEEMSAPSVSSNAPIIVTEMDNVTLHGGKTLVQLYEQNNDTIGWITVPDTPIDYVVLLPSLTVPYKGDSGTPDSHYLHHDFNHNYYYPGEIFMDARCSVSPSGMSQNMTLYGHHMADGSMFARLDKYKYQSFFKEHQYINFDTLWYRFTWRVFAVFVVDLNTVEGRAFDYRRPEFRDDEDFLHFVSAVKKKSLYDTGVDVNKGDRIITLQTCTFPTGNVNYDDARLIVMARLDTVSVPQLSSGK